MHYLFQFYCKCNYSCSHCSSSSSALLWLQVSKSLLKAVPTSETMSEAVIERPNFWKAWLLHCLVREQAPNAATRKGFWLKGNKHSYKQYLNTAFLKQLCVIRKVAGVIFVPINVCQPCWERLLRKNPAFLKLLCCRASLAGDFLTHASLPMAQHMTKKQQQCWRMQKENTCAQEAGQKVFHGHGQPGGPSRTQMMCKHLTDCTGSHHVSLNQLTESTVTTVGHTRN